MDRPIGSHLGILRVYTYARMSERGQHLEHSHHASLTLAYEPLSLRNLSSDAPLETLDREPLGVSYRVVWVHVVE